MKRILYLLLPAIALLATPSCKKSDASQNTVTPGGYASLDDIFAKAGQLTTTQSIVVSSGGEVVSKGGTHIIFSKDCFQSYSGAVITGSVDVKITDWLKKGDMMFSKVLPNSNSYAMSTSGQCYVEVTQKGVPVRLRTGHKAVVLFPQFGRTIVPGADSLYLGQKIVNSISTVNWYPIDTAGQFGTVPPDTLAMATDSLKYIAASHYLPVPGYVNFRVHLNTTVTLEQSVTFAILSELSDNCVYPIATLNNGSNDIDAKRVPAVKAILAVMGVNKGVFYAGFQPIPNPGTDSTYQMDIKQYDPNAFRLMMNVF